MYSDEWLSMGYRKGDKINIADNKRINYVLWYDNNQKNIGVALNFEYADDSHYELHYDEFLKLIEALGGDSDYTITLSKFFKDERPLYEFSDLMEKNHIEFKEIHFY